jgi:endonuclease/exonuclease/phosphatase family metal-dependent hydrolase
MRIVTYNVRYFAHGLKGLASTAGAKTRISRAISSLRELPDLVLLQEVETRSLRSGIAHRGGNSAETQLDAFMRHLRQGLRAEGVKSPYQPWYFPAHTYQLGKLKFYTTGLAMLVNSDRLAVIADNQESPKSVTHYGENTVRSAKQTRIVAHLHLEDTRGKKFHLFNTHLSLPSPFTTEFWRQKTRMGHGRNQLAEAKLLCDYMKSRSKGEPYLVGGDFNSAPSSPVYQHLTHDARLRGAQEALQQIDAKDPNGFATAGFMQMRMHLDHLFGHHIDWMDLEGTASFGDASGRFHGMSDHVPLIARFALD